MTDQTVNIPLLRKAVEWAEAEAAKPEIDSRWQQNAWLTPPPWRAQGLLEDTPYDDQCAALEALEPRCGTAYCIAGYVGQLLDERYVTTDLVDGVHVSTFAAEALGIPAAGEEVDYLFDGNNSIADVRRIAEDLAGERL